MRIGWITGTVVAAMIGMSGLALAADNDSVNAFQAVPTGRPGELWLLNVQTGELRVCVVVAAGPSAPTCSQPSAMLPGIGTTMAEAFRTANGPPGEIPCPPAGFIPDDKQLAERCAKK